MISRSYAARFTQRWRFNATYAVQALMGGLLWAGLDLTIHTTLQAIHHVQTLPITSLIEASLIDTILVSCLWFVILRTNAQIKISQLRNRDFEDEMRNAMQVVLYAVAMMDTSGQYMPQVAAGLRRMEAAMKKHYHD